MIFIKLKLKGVKKSCASCQFSTIDMHGYPKCVLFNEMIPRHKRGRKCKNAERALERALDEAAADGYHYGERRDKTRKGTQR